MRGKVIHKDKVDTKINRHKQIYTHTNNLKRTIGIEINGKWYLATDSLQSWTSVEHHLVQSFIFLSLLFSIAVSQISYSVHLLEWITQLKLNEEKLGADTFYSNQIERTKAVLFGLWIDDVYPQRLPEVFIQKSIPIKGKLWMWIEYEPFQEIFFIMFNLNSMSIYTLNSIFII